MIHVVKVKTFNQSRLLKYAKENFKKEADITVELYDDNCILLTESSGEYCYLTMMPDGTTDTEFHYGG